MDILQRQLQVIAFETPAYKISDHMFWYEEDVKMAETEISRCGYAPETIFYGSSSIRLWDTLYTDFQPLKPVNLGFGGSTLAACVWFFDRIMSTIPNPHRMIVYAGDNDLGDGRNPEEVLIFYQQLMVKVKAHFNNIPCGFISIKPSFHRWNIIDKIKYTNKLIEHEIKQQNNGQFFINVYDYMTDSTGFPKKEYFMPDGLHLSPVGYQLWKMILLTHYSY